DAHCWYSDYPPRQRRLFAPTDEPDASLHLKHDTAMDNQQAGHFLTAIRGYAHPATIYEFPDPKIDEFHHGHPGKRPKPQTGQNWPVAIADPVANKNGLNLCRHRPHSYQCPLWSTRIFRLFSPHFQLKSAMRLLRVLNPPKFRHDWMVGRIAAAPV